MFHPTLGFLFEKYNEWLTSPKESSKYADQTLYAYAKTIRHFQGFLLVKKITRLNDIELQAIHDFLSFKDKKKKIYYAKNTQQLYTTALKYFFTWAYDNNFVRHNLLISYKADKLQKNYYSKIKLADEKFEYTILKKKERQHLINSFIAIDDFQIARDAAIIGLLSTAGLYAHELGLLTLNAIDTKQHRLKFIDEYEQKREIFLDKNIYYYTYRNWLKVRKKFLNRIEMDMLFFTYRLTPISQRLLHKIVASGLASAGLQLKPQGSDVLRQTAIVAKFDEDYSHKQIKRMFALKNSLSCEKYEQLVDYYLS